jgi:hypothetical protein
VVTLLRQGAQLSQESVLTAEECGLDRLYNDWVKAIADEFVRLTRFDPLHQAATEQALFNRLPHLLGDFRHNPTVWLEMGSAPRHHRIPLDRDLLKEISANVVEQMVRLIQQITLRQDKPGRPLILEVTHKAASIPGCLEVLSAMEAVTVLPLKYGAGATGLLEIPENLFADEAGRGVSFLTHRPWLKPFSEIHPPSSSEPCVSRDGLSPTHVLYGNIARRITENPLTFGTGPDADRSHICLAGESRDVAAKHGSIQRKGEDVILQNHSPHGVWVNGTVVRETLTLTLGQEVRVGTPGETLHLICCLDS